MQIFNLFSINCLYQQSILKKNSRGISCFHNCLTLKTSSSSNSSSSMLFQLPLGTFITFSTVPLSGITVRVHHFLHPSLCWRNKVGIKNQPFTCSNKHDIVLPVSSTYSVHSDLREAVVHIGADEDRPPGHGVDGIVHERVVACKLNHIVRETLSGLEAAKGLTGTLEAKKIKSVIFLQMRCVETTIIIWVWLVPFWPFPEFVATFQENLKLWFFPKVLRVKFAAFASLDSWTSCLQSNTDT